MKRVKKIGLIFGCIISLVLIYGCSHDSGIKPDAIVTISTDKISIKADNKDKVIFTVTVGGNDITSSVVITEKNTNLPIEGISFSTDSVATYTFYAMYNNMRSNEIRVEAIAIEIILSVDKPTIKANNKEIATFTVKADGEDVTTSASIIQMESQEAVVAGSGFNTKIPGTYTFFATYKGKKSNEIKVDASAIVVSLSVDKSSIKANNWDKATFTVKIDDEDVTASAVIMQRIDKNNFFALDNHGFLTDKADIYTFYATYEDVQSNEVNVEATYVNLAFLMGYSIVQISSTACPICPLLTVELDKLTQNPSLAGQIHVITLHPSGKYCDSDLSGVLAKVAVNFVDNVQTSAPPLAIVDLYDAVHLYERDTQTPLIKALDRSTIARDWVSMTGMAVQSTTNGSNIYFDVSFKTVKTGNYHFFAFVVEDSVVNRQATGDHTMDPNYINNNVGTYLLTEGDPYQGVDLGIISVGKETTRSFSIDTGKFNTGRNVNLANCRIVCYTLRSNNGTNYFVDNVTNCPVNGSVRFLYVR